MEKKNVPIVLALSIPFVMIAVIAVSIAVPRLFFKPSFRFLYSNNNPYWSGQDLFHVQDGKLVKNTLAAVITPGHSVPTPPPNVRFWVYDPKTDASTELTFEAAQAFTLDPSVKSPDGYEIRAAESMDNVASLFFSRSREWGTIYLEGKGASRKIKSPVLREGTGLNYIHFIGWIKE